MPTPIGRTDTSKDAATYAVLKICADRDLHEGMTFLDAATMVEHVAHIIAEALLEPTAFAHVPDAAVFVEDRFVNGFESSNLSA